MSQSVALPMLGRTSQVRVYDNLDDRREIHTLLRRLHPRRRLAFLWWVCAQAELPLPRGMPAGVEPQRPQHPGVSPKTVELGRRAENDSGADERFALEVYYDVVSLLGNFNLPMERVLRRLVREVRRG